MTPSIGAPVLSLFTLNYQRFQPPMGVPVRSSNGAPRWPLKYDLRHAALLTFPAMTDVRAAHKGGLGEDEFRDRYHRTLTGRGVLAIGDELQGIADRAGDHRLVLLCFDKVDQGEWCHRRMFAEWWEQQTGDPVRELGPIGKPPAPSAQGTLL